MRSACTKAIRSAARLAAIGVATAARAQGLDPLPLCNDGTGKKSIADFVARVTTPRGADFYGALPQEERNVLPSQDAC
jgi:hypothetical protein